METQNSNDAKFKRYLVRELFWELSQHEPLPPDFAGIQPESVEVLTYRGYDDLKVRVAGFVYDIHLTWKKLQPPIISKIQNTA